MASKSNRRNRMGVDRIGTLPDAVLCYILSFLPTLYAVHTSILSKRWNKLWTSLPILEFHDDMVLYSSWNKSRFLKFVGRVIALHDSADIRKLSLSVKEHHLKDKDLDRIESWICTAIKRNLVELDLTLWNDEEPFLMPQSLFVCKTLTVLKVDSQYVTYHLPKTGCFPSLKVLCVSLHDPYDDSFINLFTCCPILEDLTIKGILGDCLPNINISAPELKILRIYLEMDSCGYPECKFFINAPKMENFDISDDYFWSHYILENGESIVNAEIRLQNRYDEKDDSLCFADRTAAILAKIYNVRYLSFLFQVNMLMMLYQLLKFVGE